MDLRHYRSLMALADEGSFTTAARKLHIVQSGLSATIKEMEAELGVTLVQRTTRRVSLTVAGALFLEYARPAIAMLSDGTDAVRSQSHVIRGRISLGILQSLSPYVNLPSVLAAFHARYPEVDFTVRSIDSPEAPNLVRNGSLDLCFHALTTRKLPAGVDATHFVDDAVVPICGKTHPLAKLKSVTLAELSRSPFVDLTPERALRTLIDRSFAEQGLDRKSMFEVSSVETMLQFVSAGLGVAIVPSAVANATARVLGLHVLPLPKQRPRMPLWRLAILVRAQRRKYPAPTVLDLMLGALMEAQR